LWRDHDHFPEVPQTLPRDDAEAFKKRLLAGVEVKIKASVTPADFAGLLGLRDQLGKRFRVGVLLYGGEQALPFGDRLWALPLETLWST